MNAYAALISGAGGNPTVPALESGVPQGTAASNNEAGAESSEPDFFVVLQDSIDGGEASSKIDDQAATTGKTDLELVTSGRPGAYEAPVADLAVDPEVPTDGEVPVEIDGLVSGDWVALSPGETDDRIPLLEIDVPTTERPEVLVGSGPADDLAAPLGQLDPGLLKSTSGSAPSGSPESDLARFGSRTPALVATIGDETALAPTGPRAPAPPPEALTASVGEATPPMAPANAIVDDPDLTLVDPELRTRLERVIQRMHAEYGHNVKVVEGFRTPERQTALFSQGRTAPGPVVTWTQHSMHTEGLAVDVVVDGSYAPHEGYRRLAQIAQEEGLETLGPKDLGHLQLVKSEGEASGDGETRPGIAKVARAAQPAQAAAPARMASVSVPAAIAEPATVARPASMAAPAEVAVPGSGSQATPIDSAQGAEQLAFEGEPADAETRLAALAAATSRASRDEDVPFGDRARTASLARAALNRARRANGGQEPTGRTPSLDVDPRLAASSPNDTANAPAPTVKTPSVVAAEALHRVTQVREIQELSYPKKLGQVTLRMLDGLSEEARMRVSLTESGVATSIGVRDLAQADRMRSRIGTLEQALRQRGLESLSVRVGALGTTPTLDAAALTATAITGNRGASESDGFLNWQSGSDARSTTEDSDGPHEQSENRRQPSEHQQENHQ